MRRMKKTNRTRLRVDRETVRILTERELASVAGGLTAHCPSKPCTSYGCPTNRECSMGAQKCTASNVCSYEC
jgi:hypothetical protein